MFSNVFNGFQRFSTHSLSTNPSTTKLNIVISIFLLISITHLEVICLLSIIIYQHYKIAIYSKKLYHIEIIEFNDNGYPKSWQVWIIFYEIHVYSYTWPWKGQSFIDKELTDWSISNISFYQKNALWRIKALLTRYSYHSKSNNGRVGVIIPLCKRAMEHMEISKFFRTRLKQHILK